MNNQTPTYVVRRLNSLMRQVTDIENMKKVQSFERVEVIWKAYVKLHQQISENVDVDESFPRLNDNEKPHDSDILLELIKTQIREIADNLSVDLDVDKTNTVPNTMFSQYISQTNVQTLNNLINNINSLSIPVTDKEKITLLAKEFEEESKNKKQPEKLRGLLFKVAELSIDAAGFLLKHAHEMGVLKNLLSI